MKVTIRYLLVSVAFFLGIAVQCAPALTEYEALLKSYGNVSSVAGLVGGGTNGVCDWLPAMEGAPATNVDLSTPHTAMADRYGNIFIADKDAYAVRKVTPDGIIHTFAGTLVPGFGSNNVATQCAMSTPNGLYVFPDGTTYIIDSGNQSICVVDPISNRLTVVCVDTNMNGGRGLWVSGDRQTIYYGSMKKLMRWTSNGTITNIVGGFTKIGNIAVDPRDPPGHIIVTDIDDRRVFRVHDDGTKELFAGDGGKTNDLIDGVSATNISIYGPRGICFEPNGGCYVSTQDDGDLWYIDTQGIIHRMINGSKTNLVPSGEGKPVTDPSVTTGEGRGVTLAPNGDLIITETDNGFVRKIPRVARCLSVDFGTEGGVASTWTSQYGYTNVVEFKTNLSDLAWEILHQSVAPSTSTMFSFDDTNTFTRQVGFYRIRRRPAF